MQQIEIDNERIRRQLWADTFLKYIDHPEKYTWYGCIEKADETLKCYDNTFPPPLPPITPNN